MATRDVDSAQCGLAWASFAPVARNHSCSRLRCPLVQERRRAPNLVASDLLLLPQPHHQHPSTFITSSYHLHHPPLTHIQKPRQTTQISRNGSQAGTGAQNTPSPTRFDAISFAHSTDSHFRRLPPPPARPRLARLPLRRRRLARRQQRSLQRAPMTRRSARRSARRLTPPTSTRSSSRSTPTLVSPTVPCPS